MHPWSAPRIAVEKELIKEYGLRNKKEIWKAESKLLDIKRQVKHIVASSTKQAEKEKTSLISKLFRYNLIQKDTKVEEILSLTIHNLLKRRLQTIVFEKKLTHSPLQARQLITHRHVFIENRIVAIPSYFVTRDEEQKITLSPNIKIFEQEKKQSKK